MSREPATRHFTPAQLAEFLQQLGEEPAQAAPPAPGQVDAPREPPTRALRPRPTERSARAPGAEPPTVLGSAHVIPIGAPRWRVRTQLAALAPDAARVELRDPSSFEGPGSVEREVLQLTRAKPWRVAFVIVALLSVGLLAALMLRTSARSGRVAKTLRPPPLPAQRAEPEPSAPARATPVLVPIVEPATPATAAHERAVPAVSPAQPIASEPLRAITARAAARAVTEAPRASARREAVDLLLSGRSSAALDAYRALISAAEGGAQTAALQHVVRLLEREQDACSPQKGTRCSL